MMTGAKLFVEALKKENVEYLFGFPGGAVIPIFDVLYSEPAINVILTRHEQGAVHAADGYARSTGRVGVCIVTSGPGATNTITGLATANFDSVPIVCFSGQVPTKMIGNDAFQEADTVGLSRSITKHNYLVYDRKDLGRIIKEAFHIARSGRPGPVVVDLPKDVLVASMNDGYPEKIIIRGYNPVSKGHAGQIKKAAQELFKAKKPLFYIGGGIHISGASEALKKLVDKTQIPVVSSLMGIGAIPSDHPLFLGMVGMHGTFTANFAVMESDLIFAIGTRFDDRVTGKLDEFAPHAEIIHIDIDPAVISQNIPVKIPIVGDARQVIQELLPLLKPMKIDSWLRQIRTWQAEHPLVDAPGKERLSPTKVIKGINQVFPDAIIATDVGQHQMWTAQFFNFQKSRTLLTSGGLGTMGYGFPAAIGAQIGNRNKRVVSISGDGSIQMNIQELATAVLNELPVIIAIMNNEYLGMVRQWQELFFDKRYSSTCLGGHHFHPKKSDGTGASCPPYVPDFVRLAEAYDAVGIRVQKEEEIIPSLEKAKAIKDKPIVLEFIIEQEANVMPMVPAGTPINKMILQE
jgi:acetolactate synthase-1/2/3 large subunit